MTDSSNLADVYLTKTSPDQSEENALSVSPIPSRYVRTKICWRIARHSFPNFAYLLLISMKETLNLASTPKRAVPVSAPHPDTKTQCPADSRIGLHTSCFDFHVFLRLHILSFRWMASTRLRAAWAQQFFSYSEVSFNYVFFCRSVTTPNDMYCRWIWFCFRWLEVLALYTIGDWEPRSLVQWTGCPPWFFWRLVSFVGFEVHLHSDERTQSCRLSD